MQKGLRIIEQWCLSVGLNVNPTKTTVVPFTRKRNLPAMKTLTLNGNILEWGSEVKYLGITLDSKLLWNKHVDNATGKATRALMACRRLCGRNWGCNPKILRWMYVMIVRPIITYGAVAWFAKAGAMRTLEIITDLTPLHLVIDRVAHEAILRLSKEGTGNERIKSQRVWSSLNDYISSANLPSDLMIKKVSIEKNFSTMLSKRRDWEREYTAYNLKENTLKWYTDGSKTATGAGAGIYGIKDKDGSKNL
ncbi:uncharacterized protein LOC123314087 [Coccinella septempunctata]|uniref:uncharacterized protein LOC123314087 n=1 Tax=Coccinella septempunctata TaxID=41139 RepID=UPI001D05D2FE|nr:uncharacterized protein LOC123314087 [Coccinella septempunctata]